MALALLLLAFLSSSAGVPASSRFRVLDDTGQEVTSPVRVCFYAGLLTQCLDQAPYRIPPTLAAFTSVTAEGPGHGPIAVERRALQQDRNGEHLLRVPRKARILLRTSAGPPLAISLYPVDDVSFRKPAFRVSGVSPEGVLVPAGDFLLVVSDGTHAPALSTSTLKPGSRNTFPYLRRPGWSVVSRCQSSTAMVPGCLARTLSASRPSSQRELGRASGNRQGLVAFEGLNEPFVTLAVSAPGFVPQEVRGVSARNGTFAFEPAVLSRGGAARARVTLDDQPVRRAGCRLVDLHSNDVGPPTEETLYDGATSAEGICETSRVLAGTYVLRLTPSTTAQATDQPVTLGEGETSELEIRLHSLPVTGKVYRGTRTVPGAIVRVARREDMDRYSSAYLELTTDDAGEFRGVIWSTGEYSFVAMNAARSAVGTVRRVAVDEDGAEVDLHLNPNDIGGRVQDEERRPIPAATVLLTRNEHTHRATKTGADGAFAFPMDGDGLVRLTAQKAGYQPAEPFELTLAADAEVAPVVLTMKKLPSVKGTVLWPTGSPAPNVGVGSFRAAPGEAPAALGSQRTDATGAFEVPRSPTGMTEVFVTGQGCPLLAANVPPGVDDVTLRCPVESAGVQLLLRDTAAVPQSHESVILRWEGTLIPRAVLRDHLLLLGLPTETDGAGRLILVGLPVGLYDIFLGRGASEATVAAGMPHGHLTTVQLGSFDRPEIEVTVQ